MQLENKPGSNNGIINNLSLIHTYEADADARRRPRYEASNFEARFDARISKRFDILASNYIVFCILMNTIVRLFD